MGSASGLGALGAEQRLSFLRGTLDDQASRATTWSVGWAISGLGLAAGSVGLAALESDRDQRYEWLISGAPALWYPLMAVVDPPEVIEDHRLLEELVTMTRGPRGWMAPCILVYRGEDLLARAARDEQARHDFFQHALGVVVSAAIAVLTATALHDVPGGVLNGVGSVAVSELNLWTLPTGAVDALERYRAGDLGSRRAAAVGVLLPFAW